MKVFLSPDVDDECLCVGPAHELVGLEAEADAQVAHRLHHRLLEEPLVALDPHAVVVPDGVLHSYYRSFLTRNCNSLTCVEVSMLY